MIEVMVEMDVRVKMGHDVEGAGEAKEMLEVQRRGPGSTSRSPRLTLIWRTVRSRSCGGWIACGCDEGYGSYLARVMYAPTNGR